jgi:hypothetical protein
MAIVTTINHLTEVIYPAFIECLKEDNLEEKIIESATYLNELMQERIFEQGLASDEDTIASIVRADPNYEDGDYSEKYGEKRALNDKQTAFIDLLFTGKLRAFMTVGEFDNKIAIGFLSEEMGLLAGYHEEYRQKDIFAPTPNEIELTGEFLLEGMTEYLKECLESQP